MAAGGSQRPEQARFRWRLAVLAFVAVMPPVVATSELPFWQALFVTTVVAAVAIPLGMALLGWRDRRTAT